MCSSSINSIIVHIDLVIASCTSCIMRHASSSSRHHASGSWIMASRNTQCMLYMTCKMSLITYCVLCYCLLARTRTPILYTVQHNNTYSLVPAPRRNATALVQTSRNAKATGKLSCGLSRPYPCAAAPRGRSGTPCPASSPRRIPRASARPRGSAAPWAC